MTELELLKQELNAMKGEIAELEAKASAGDDYRQITNAIMGHVYCYYSHQERHDLETFWVTGRDDIVYAHNTIGSLGKQGVWEYYIDGTDGRKANYAKTAKEIYNLDIPEGAAAGYRVIHVMGSPFIEIAKDRKTAQGIWMSFSFMSNMDDEGYANPSFVLQRFAGDFLNENGVWKLWHIRDYTDVSMNIEVSLTDPDKVERDAEGRPIEQDGPGIMPKSRHEKDEGPGGAGGPQPTDGKKQRKLDLKSSNMYEAWTCTVNEPAIPTPYDKWDPAQSCITFVKEHQDEQSAFIVE